MLDAVSGRGFSVYIRLVPWLGRVGMGLYLWIINYRFTNGGRLCSDHGARRYVSDYVCRLVNRCSRNLEGLVHRGLGIVRTWWVYMICSSKISSWVSSLEIGHSRGSMPIIRHIFDGDFPNLGTGFDGPDMQDIPFSWCRHPSFTAHISMFMGPPFVYCHERLALGL